MSTGDATFSSRLKEERLRLGLSQAQAGEICETSREVWGRYETGKNWPGSEVLLKFTKAGADIQFIFAGSRLPYIAGQAPAVYASDELKQIADAFAHADQLGRDAILAVARAIKKSPD